MYSEQGFQQDGTVQLFGTAGQAKLFCPGTKGHRDRSSFIVPGQRDYGTSSKSCHGTGRAKTASQNPGWDAGQDNHHFFSQNLGRDREGMGQSLIFSNDFLFYNIFSVLEETFPVLEHPFLFWNVLFLFQNVFFPVLCFFKEGHFVQGQRVLSQDICFCSCPGTKGHRDKIFFLSWDKGTTGRPVPVCPGTSRPLETLKDRGKASSWE